MGKVMDLAVKAGLRVSNDLNKDADLYLIPNAPRQLINKLMDSGKVFLHATINENWGIAVAEAMARGLPTVVHKSGGTWSDLVEEGARGLGYSDVNDAINAVAKLITDGKDWSHYSLASVDKAKNMTLKVFINKFSEILKEEDLI